MNFVCQRRSRERFFLKDKNHIVAASGWWYIGFMRALLIMLVFAIGFGGYMAAASAFDGGRCDTIHVGHDDPSVMGHDNNDRSISNDSAKNTADICLDCHHCCVSHAIDGGISFVSFDLRQGSLNILPAKLHKEERLFSLLRPPRILV